MVAASILPVAVYKNELYFLFGKENEMEDSAKGFADFGGGVEPGESIMETALREGAEEMSGFLGDSYAVKKLINKNGGFYKLVNDKTKYNIHIFCMDYDANLPVYFTNFHKFIWNHKHMDKKKLNSSKLFEKQEIKWFSTKELKTKRKEFRPFYREIVDQFVDELPDIRRFIMNKRSHNSFSRNNRNTRKQKGGA